MTPQEHILTALQKRWPMVDPQLADVAFEALKDWMKQAYPLPKHTSPPPPAVYRTAVGNCSCHDCPPEVHS